MDAMKIAMGKKWVDVGGWKCPCCRPRNADHRKAYRYARRVLKQALGKIMNEYE